MDHNSPLDGGGLYALRAGRCGCDSLSLAGSRQRVKSLRSSVRLRLVIYTARSILSRRVFRCAPHTSSEGSQESETVPSADAPVTDSPEEVVSVRSRYSVLRSCFRVTASGFPASHRSLMSPLPVRLQSLRLHTPHQLVRTTGLTRPTVVAVSAHIQTKCKWRSHRHHSLQPYPVRHLPRATPLPARVFCPSGFTADAVKPTLQKPPSPSILAHASAYCQNPPASPARKRHQGHTYLQG